MCACYTCRSGNLVYSSSRDGTILFWDMLSGISVRCLSPYAASASSASTAPYAAGRGYSQSFVPTSSASAFSGADSTAGLQGGIGAGPSTFNSGSGEGAGGGYSPHSSAPVGGGEVS
jgi:hypothetical protein